MSDHTLFVVAPFVSIVVLVVAATLRAPNDSPVRVRPSPSSVERRRRARRPSLAAIGFLGLLLGHVVIIAAPDLILIWSRDLSRLMAFELVLLALGAVALVGAGTAFVGNVLRRTGNGANLVDAAFLGVLLLTMVSGLGIAVVYRWAAAWSAMTVAGYARSLVSLEPNVEPLASLPYLVKLHIFSSFIVMALLAFTPLIDALLNGLLRAAGALSGPFVSIVDRQWRLLQEWVRRSGRNLMWPEEED